MRSQLQISIAVNVFCLIIVGALCGFVYYEVSALRGKLAEIKESASSEIKKLKETLSETKDSLFEDYNDLKDRIIINTIEERRSNLAFANALIDAVQASGAVIINKNLALPNNEFGAAEWAGNARMEARAISAVAYDRQEILSTLTSTKFGDSWLIEFDGEKSIKLYDWLKGIDVVKGKDLTRNSSRPLTRRLSKALTDRGNSPWNRRNRSHLEQRKKTAEPLALQLAELYLAHL